MAPARRVTTRSDGLHPRMCYLTGGFKPGSYPGPSGQPDVHSACKGWLWPWSASPDVVGGTVPSTPELVSVVVMIDSSPKKIFIIRRTTPTLRTVAVDRPRQLFNPRTGQ